MRNDAVKQFYGKPEAFKAAIGDYLKNVLNHYNKFAGYAANECMVDKVDFDCGVHA